MYIHENNKTKLNEKEDIFSENKVMCHFYKNVNI